jgi:hypothetical protein
MEQAVYVLEGEAIAGIDGLLDGAAGGLTIGPSGSSSIARPSQNAPRRIPRPPPAKG